MGQLIRPACGTIHMQCTKSRRPEARDRLFLKARDIVAGHMIKKRMQSGQTPQQSVTGGMPRRLF
jgi:hypothetical protein